MKRGIYWNNKLYGIIFIGFLLFSGSMMVFLDFFEEKDYQDVEYFILVNDGVFSYLDSKGYNLEFTTKINGVLLKESKTSVESKQIVVESENPFGKTSFIFDRLNSKEVKFSINHQGNIQRDYEFSMILVNKGLKMHRSKAILAWQSGYLDFNDMQVEEGFKIDQNWWSKDIILIVNFLNTADFYIDPLLSQDLVLDSVNVARFDVSYQSALENQTDFFWDTTNITDWNQWNSANEGEFGVYSNSLLQNGDFGENYDSSVFDTSIDDDFAAWYSKSGSVSLANNSDSTLALRNPAINNTHYEMYEEYCVVSLNYNEANGSSVAIDSSAYENNGTYVGNPLKVASFRTEANNSMNQIRFSDQYVNVPDNPDFEVGYGDEHNAMSFETWIYVDLALSAWPVNKDNYYTEIGVSRAINIHFAQTGGHANWIRAYTDDDIFEKFEWFHLAWSYNGNKSSQGITLYLNGVAVPSSSMNYASGGTYNGSSDTSNNLIFGNSGTEDDHTGKLDETRLYKGMAMPADYWNWSFQNSNYSINFTPNANPNEFPQPYSDKQVYYNFNNDSYQIPLKNAYCESGDDGNWTTEAINGFYNGFTTSGVYVHSGSWGIGARFYAGSYHTSWIYQNVTCLTNELTEVSGWFKMADGYNITLYFTDDTNYTEDFGTNGGNWGKETLTLANVPEYKLVNCVEFRVHYTAGSSINYAAMDDFTLSYGNPILVQDLSGHNRYGIGENDPIRSVSFNVDANYSMALSKNGNIEYVNITNSADSLSFDNIRYNSLNSTIYETSSDFSIEAWVFIASDPATDIVFVEKNFEYILGANRTDSTSFYPYFRLFNNSDMNDYISTESDISIALGNWHYLVAVCKANGTKEGLNIYINSSLISQTRSSNNTFVSMTNSGYNVLLGNDTVGQSIKFDEFAIYDRQLSALRISTTYISAPFTIANNNSDSGRFSINYGFIELELDEIVAQDVYLDSDNLTNILFDCLDVGDINDSSYLLVSLIYSDAGISTQRYNFHGDMSWFGNVSSDMLGKVEFNNISLDKVISTVQFESHNFNKTIYLDNVYFNYSIDYDFHSPDEFVWKPIGLNEYSVNGTSQQRSWFFHHRNDSAYVFSGIFTNNSFLSLDHDAAWIIELNLTFNPYSAFWNDLSFAGGIQLHFLDSSNNSLSFIDLIDNSTSSGLHQVGGSLFYNTSSSSGVFAKDHEYDSSNYNLTNELLRIKKVNDILLVNYPESLDFGGNWTNIGNTSIIFQQGNPVNLGLLFFRNASTRSMDYPNINSTNKDYFTAGNDYSENFTGISVPEYSRYVFDSSMSISSLNFSYYEALTIDETNTTIGDLYGFLVDGSNQVFYEFNYTIAYPDNVIMWVYHNHSFLMPHNYTFVNVTFGDGTVKTIISGFSVSSFNGTHDEYSYEDSVNGTFTWFFLTGNAITDFIINPQWSINGTLVNQNLIEYNIRVANGSTGLLNYPVNVSLKNTNEEILYSVQEVTGLNGWLNSSFNQQSEMLVDHEFWVCATGINQSFLGYAVDFYLAYNDWADPVISNLVYNASLTAGTAWHLTADISDNWTNQSDLTVQMKWSFISSSSYDRTSNLILESGLFTLSIIGQDADESLWFKIQATDNLSNQVETATFQVDWVAPTEAEPTPSPGNGAAPAARPVAAEDGIDPIFLVIVFAAGAIMVAVIGYAVVKRVVVRTRKVETREVITTIGRFGRSKEKIEEKGG